MKHICVVAFLLIGSIVQAAPATAPAGARVDIPPVRVVQADSLESFQRAIKDAAPGDQIVLADGAYTTTEAVIIDRAGTAEHPILITAQSIGGVQIKGKAGFSFGETAAYVVLRGFQFLHSNEVMRLPVGSHHLRITRNEFAYLNDARSPYVTVSGDDCEFDYNTFRDKATEGCMITVQGPGGSGMAQRTWIHHNLFKNFKPSANNCSAIQVGLSGRSLSSANSLVEHNLFLNCRGENEGGICNKSCDNTYRYNTFGEGTTELSLRHGNGCKVYANYFIGSDGVRFFGHDHQVFSNHFERCRAAITIGNGGGIVPRDKLTSHDKPVNVKVAFNTLVNNRTNIQMLGRNRGLGAADIMVANNVIVGGNKAATLGGTIENAVWQGNVVWNTNGGAGDIPAGGFEIADPKNRREPVAGNYDFAIVDIDGQAVGVEKDAGADQPGGAPKVNRILTEKEVGVGAGG